MNTTTNRTASHVFGLEEIARATVDGTEYVVYRDDQYRWAVPASAWDHVAEEYTDQYSMWCAEDGAGVGDRGLCALIAAAAELDGLYAAGACVWVEAARG